MYIDSNLAMAHSHIISFYYSTIYQPVVKLTGPEIFSSDVLLFSIYARIMASLNDV